MEDPAVDSKGYGESWQPDEYVRESWVTSPITVNSYCYCPKWESALGMGGEFKAQVGNYEYKTLVCAESKSYTEVVLYLWKLSSSTYKYIFKKAVS